MLKYIFVFLFILCSGLYQIEAQTVKRVACIGNSVTYGAGLKDPARESYPAVLQALLGPEYQVGNFGRSGATLLKKGHNPYFRTAEFRAALAFKPDVAIIHLGLNDTDPRNWPDYKNDFEADYAWLIDTFKTVNPNVKVYVSRLTPIFSGHPRFISGTRDWHGQIQELIPVIARANEAQIIDLNTPLYSRPDLFADNLHPDKEGAAIIARTVYEVLSGKFGGLKLPQIFSSHMVVQRGMEIPVYGKADAGETIKVNFAGQDLSVKTDSQGDWKLRFPARQAGGPYTLRISSSTKEILFQDILIGDIWLAAGQSNMAFQLQNSMGARQELMQPAPKNLRLFKMKGLRETDAAAWDSLSLDQTNRLQFFTAEWTASDVISAASFSAVAYYFGKELSTRENIPIGIIELAVGGVPIESFIDRNTLSHHDQLVHMLSNWRKSDFIMPWVRERADINLEKSLKANQRHPYQPAYNYEAGIARLIESPIKGVIWYQGESNAHNADLYRIEFKALVESWRKAWKQQDLPFYYVQLSSIGRPSWPEFRNMQRELLTEIPNTGMAVSSDLGDSLDVHPTQKAEIGHRLALLALKQSYHKDLIFTGPEALTAAKHKQEVIVTFSGASKLTSQQQQPLQGFELLNDKGQTIQVAGIIQGNQVILNVPPGQRIKSVRYAWQPFTRANLTNAAGLPASTFSMPVTEE